MSAQSFFEALKNNPRPVVVEVWAPWCAPCKVMAPDLNRVSEQYSAQVELWKVNADEQPEVAQALKVFGIPTLIGYAGGKEILRRTGTLSEEGLKAFFASVVSGKVEKRGPAPVNRMLRLYAGVMALLLGWVHSSWLLAGVGGVLVFSAVYDRCPVWRAVSPYLANLFRAAGGVVRRNPDQSG